MAGLRSTIAAAVLFFLAAVPSDAVSADGDAARELRIVKIIHPVSQERSPRPDVIDARDGMFYWLQHSTGIHRFDKRGEPLGAVELDDPSDLMRYNRMDVSQRGILLVGDRVRLITTDSDESWQNYDLAAAHFLGDGYLYVKSKLGDPGSDLLTVVDNKFAQLKVLDINPLGMETNRAFESDLLVEQAGGKLYLLSPYRPQLIVHNLETGSTREVDISCHYAQYEWLFNKDYKTLRPPHLQGMSPVVHGLSIAGERLYVCCDGRRLLKVFVYDLEGEYIELYIIDLNEAGVDGGKIFAVQDMKVLLDEGRPVFFMLAWSEGEQVVAVLCPD